jgi:hypothetical protein
MEQILSNMLFSCLHQALLSASIKAMQESLDRIQKGIATDDIIATFSETKDVVGFTKYAREEKRYKVD